MEDTEKDGKGVTKKVEGLTLEEALEITGFGWYNYLLVTVAGINVLGNFAPMMIFSYVVPATDCDLNLTVSQKGLLSSVIFTGMILTTHMFGYLADEYGRKYVATICNLLSGLLTVLSAFCPDFTSLVVVTFINGAINAGVLMPTYVYVGESTALKYRPQSLLLCGAFGYTATMFLPLLAIFTIPLVFQWDILGFVTFKSWRLLLLLASVTPIIGSALNLLLHESPKYLLTKGRAEETMEALQFMYRLNHGGSKSDFPVKGPICLDANDIESVPGEKASFKRIWTQTVLLFKKPLKKITIIACLYQAGLNGACNLMFVRLAQLTAEIRSYALTNPDYGVTLCQLLQREIVAHNSTLVEDSSTPVRLEGPCAAVVPVDTYYIAAATGLGQVCFFIISGPLTRLLGNKTLLVVYTFSSVVFCLAMVLNTNQLATILCMTLMTIMLETSLPISVTILMEHFPTSVRSTASCISLAFGRIATTVGTMVMAELQTGYCDLSYYGLSIVLIALGILAQTCIKGTSKKPDS